MAGLKTRFSDFFKYMTPYLPGSEEPLLLQTMQMTVRDFFNETEVWEENLGLLNLVEDVAEYELSHDWCARIQRILKVYQNDDAGVTAGNPGTLIVEDNYNLVLENDDLDILKFEQGAVPSVSVTSGLGVRVVFVPILDACDLPTWLGNRWSVPIIAGTKKRMMLMPRKSWTNAAGAVTEAAIETDGINKAKQENPSTGMNFKSRIPGFGA